MTTPIITPEGNILVPLTADPDGLQALVYIDAEVSDRNGTKPMPAWTGVTDKWRFMLNVRAVLAIGGVIQNDINGNELECAVPAGYQSRSVDVADLLHDPRVLPCVGMNKAIGCDLLSGVLVPIDPNAAPAEPEAVPIIEPEGQP